MTGAVHVRLEHQHPPPRRALAHALGRHRHGHGPDTLRGYAADAGFGSVEILPIENDFFRFHQVRP